jgi:hypothetical protein
MPTKVAIRSQCASGAPELATAETAASTPRPSSSHSLTEQDFQALDALTRRLAGGWACDRVKDEGGSVHACITRQGNWDPYRPYYLVARRGGMLRLMVSRAPYGPQTLGGYESVAELGEALGRNVGWRRI